MQLLYFNQFDISLLYYILSVCNIVTANFQFTILTRDDREWLFMFPFPPIPIPNFVTNSHSHGIPTGLFPFPPIPIPKQSLISIVAAKHLWLTKRHKPNIQYHTALVIKYHVMMSM